MVERTKCLKSMYVFQKLKVKMICVDIVVGIPIHNVAGVDNVVEMVLWIIM